MNYSIPIEKQISIIVPVYNEEKGKDNCPSGKNMDFPSTMGTTGNYRNHFNVSFYVFLVLSGFFTCQN